VSGESGERGEVSREIFALSSDRADAPVDAMRALRSRGRDVVPALLEAIRADKLGGVALGRLLELLAEVDPNSALSVATNLLDDPRSHVAYAARRTLALVANPRARQLLLDIAGGPDADAAAHARILLDD